MRPPGSQARGLICLSKLGRRDNVLGLQRENNSQKDEEEEIFCKQMPAGHTEAIGQRGILTNTLLNFSSLSRLVPACSAVVMCGDGSLPRAGPLSGFFQAGRGRSQVLPGPSVS